MTMEHVYDDPEFCGFLVSQTIELRSYVQLLVHTLCPEVEIFWDEHLDMPLKLCLWVSFFPLPSISQAVKLKIESSIETIETSSIDQLEKANEEHDEVSLCDS